MNKKKINTAGFEVPKDYFQNFEAQLEQKIKQESIIDIQTSSNGFQVPDNYFDTFEKVLQERIDEGKKKTPIISIFSRRNIVSFSAIAAAILILIMIIPVKNGTSFDFEKIAISDIQEYIEDGDVTLSDTDIAALFENENSLPTIEGNLNNDTLFEYLSEENIENDILDFE